MRTIYLPDVNVWLALAFDSHTSHPVAAQWLAGASEASFAFCRATQSGFLRMATNASAFPHDAVTMPEAWNLHDRIRADRRAIFAEEPADLERHWRKLADRPTRSHHLWADAYLAAFALAGGYEMVTLDRGFAQFNLPHCTMLV